MSNLDSENSAEPFAPVPVFPRTDGWTPEKQLAFIEALGATGCVTSAAAIVGMGRESAYRLRARPDAAGFRAAWEAAMNYNIVRLNEAAFDRALNGVPVPIFYKGEQVGERRHFDERLTTFLLRMRDPVRHHTPMEGARIRWGTDVEGIARHFHKAAAALFGRRLPPPLERD